MKRCLITMIIGILALQTASAQDSRFSQYFILPTWLNPALSGQYDGAYRLSGVYRDQWRGPLDQPMSVFGFNADTRFEVQKNKAASDRVSVALLLLNDRSRVNDFNTNHISLSGAYHKVLDVRSEQYISAGATFGISQFGFNYNNVTFGDQYDGVDGYTNPTGEPLPPNNIAVADLGLGVVYTNRFRPNAKLYFGVAGHHINQPNRSFFNQIEDIVFPFEKEDRYPLRLSAYLMTAIDVNKIDQITPRLLYLQQGDVSEINFGTTYKKGFYTSRPTALHLGAMVSVADHLESYHMNSVTALIGFEVSDLITGLSYEYFLNETNRFGTFGAFELSLTYVGNLVGEEDYCPKF